MEDVHLWLAAALVAAGGLVGGAANALMTDNGFLMPQSEHTGTTTIVRPGFAGNMFIGLVAAVVSWGLYGPASGIAIVIGSGSGADTSIPKILLTLAGLVGGVLVGIGGARWLTNEVDKKLLRAAASEAAATPENADQARRIANASPAEALNLARGGQAPTPQPAS